MRKGDLFLWRYKDGSKGAKGYMPYWCAAQKAEFNGTHLIDSYWGDCNPTGKHWTPEEAERELELTFVANRDELELADSSAHDYYEPTDVVDLRHSNRSDYKAIFIRRGAKRSAQRMRETLEYTIERSESQIRMARSRIERCEELLAKLETEPLENVYVLSMK